MSFQATHLIALLNAFLNGTLKPPAYSATTNQFTFNDLAPKGAFTAILSYRQAGIETHGLNPNAVKVMAEAGVDISGHKSQHIDEFRDIPLDVIVTVCGHTHETCPFFPVDCKVVHVGFGDPPRMAKELAELGCSEEEQLECYRKIRNEIRAYVETLPS